MRERMIPSGVLTSNPETLVAVTLSTSKVILIGLVHAVLELPIEVAPHFVQSLVVVVRIFGVGLIRDRLGGGTITNDLHRL